MAKMVIVEKDSVAASVLTNLADALGLDVHVNLSWNPAILLMERNELDILFLNIELPRIRFDELVNHFGGDYAIGKPAALPIIYMYHHAQSTFLDRAMGYPHAGVLKRPFSMEDAFEMINENMALDKIPSKEERLRKRLQEFEEFGKFTWEWLESLKNMLEED